MKLSNIIAEIEFYTYEGMIQVIYDPELSETKLAELIRALPGVTTVSLASDEGENRETMKVKLISQKDGLTAFQSLKSTAIKRYPPIRVVNIATNTIERK